jgi:hypothetical protein
MFAAFQAFVSKPENITAGVVVVVVERIKNQSSPFPSLTLFISMKK